MALSETLGVSRGPIREAIGRLAAEGLVTVRPRRGAVVRALSSEEFLEAYQVREALETMAVAPRRSEADRPRTSLPWSMRSTRCPPAATAGDVQGFFEANTAFHRVFFDAAGQPDARRPLPAAPRADRPAPARARSSCAATSAGRSPSTRRSFAQRRRATSSEPSISCPSTSAYRRSGCSSRTTQEPA